MPIPSGDYMICRDCRENLDTRRIFSSVLEGRHRRYHLGQIGVSQQHGFRHAVVNKNARKGVKRLFFCSLFAVAKPLFDNVDLYKVESYLMSFGNRALSPLSPYFINLKTGFSLLNKMCMGVSSRRGFGRSYSTPLHNYRRIHNV